MQHRPNCLIHAGMGICHCLKSHEKVLGFSFNSAARTSPAGVTTINWALSLKCQEGSNHWSKIKWSVRMNAADRSPATCVSIAVKLINWILNPPSHTWFLVTFLSSKMVLGYPLLSTPNVIHSTIIIVQSLFWLSWMKPSLNANSNGQTAVAVNASLSDCHAARP